jgi:hypothetical protein
MAKLSKAQSRKRLNEADKKLMLVFNDGHHHLSLKQQKDVLDYAMKIRKIAIGLK